ncbi:N-acetylmuramoyl-L-alanine amidase [Neobacillus drentensis]|uniref:peptidoglycan recognition protein family protein n=1 Tax=Neobacillus drentensis TaxID=220684 RepID=UPI002FFE6195
MIEIKQMLVPVDKKPKYTVGGKKIILPMKPEYITIHETDNPSPTANDLAHARLQLNGNSRLASWHLQVDEDSCIQSIPFDECAIHGGDGINGKGNRKSIAIEICVNKGGNFKNAVKNAAEVTLHLMEKFNIPIEKVVQHNHWSGKNCPRNLRSGEKGIKWDEFINMLVPKPAVKGVTSNKAMWDNMELKKSQIGKITILKPINLWSRNQNNELEFVKILQPNEVYRVYSFDNLHGGQFGVGNGLYVTNLTGYLNYSTPSPEKLKEAQEFYKK